MEYPPCPESEECQRRPIPLAVHGNLDSSEFYFPCHHRSVRMEPEMALHLLALEDSKRKRLDA